MDKLGQGTFVHKLTPDQRSAYNELIEEGGLPAFLDLTMDYAFKLGFQDNTDGLASLIGDILQKEIIEIKTIHNEIPGRKKNSKSIRLDLRCKTETESFIVEMQNYHSVKDDPNRFIYYIADEIVSSVHSGSAYGYSPVYLIVIYNSEINWKPLPIPKETAERVVLKQPADELTKEREKHIFWFVGLEKTRLFEFGKQVNLIVCTLADLPFREEPSFLDKGVEWLYYINNLQEYHDIHQIPQRMRGVANNVIPDDKVDFIAYLEEKRRRRILQEAQETIQEAQETIQKAQEAQQEAQEAQQKAQEAQQKAQEAQQKAQEAQQEAQEAQHEGRIAAEKRSEAAEASLAKAVINLFLKGYSYEDLSSLFGKSVEEIQSIIERFQQQESETAGES